MLYDPTNILGGVWPFFLIPAVLYFVLFWDLLWKGIALWKCGRNNQPWWFFFILIANSVGILPIIYLLFFQKKAKK